MYNDDDDDRFALEDFDPLDPRHQFLNERSRQCRLLILRRRRVRDMCDPYDVTYESFVKTYRLSQTLTLTLIDLIRPFMPVTRSPLALPLHLKVLAVLSFFASGSYQVPTGRQFDVAVAQPTLSGYIDEVVNALNEDVVLYQMFKFPNNVQEVEHCINRNRLLGGKISRVVGYTDGTLIKIKKPSLANNRQAFIGRKSFASLNAQITCDRRCYILNVVPNFPGSTNDSYVFSMSALRGRMQELYAQRRCHLLGDAGYTLEEWMMTPFSRQERPEEDTPEERYNKIHAVDRNVVETCIGLLKGVFRALNDERVLHYDYVKVAKLINAIVVVHNLRVLGDVPHFMDDENLENNNFNEADPPFMEQEFEVPGAPRGGALGRAAMLRARAVRHEIVQELEEERLQRH